MFPVNEQVRPTLAPSQTGRAKRLAETLRREFVQLIPPPKFRFLVADEILTAPAIHLDDQSAIAATHGFGGSSYLQERARTRASAGDYVLTAAPPHAAYESYCERQLGLGRVRWLTVSTPGDPRRLASHAMQARSVRRELVRALRQDDVRYLHPYMGHDNVWELALLLHDAARRPLKVLAPFPGLTRWVNDKVSFAETVSRLFGDRLLPETHEASNLAVLSEHVRTLAEHGRAVVLKVPDSASGAGNVVLKASDFVGRSLGEIRERLKVLVSDLPWQSDKHLLVSSWENAFAAPSVQLWIPPIDHGAPIIEGLFEQAFEGQSSRFVGSRAAALPSLLAEEIANRAALLGLTFQHLGYVGRLSFDLILAGNGPSSARIAFIEANGRWGGTSTPMTLMSRLCGRWWARPYVARGLNIPGLDRIDFDTLLAELDDELFDVRSGHGRLVIYNPASVAARSVLHGIGLGESAEAAQTYLETTVTERCRAIAG